MKKLILLAIVAIFSKVSVAQVMFSSIPQDSVMDHSAVVEVKSNDRGFLLPRLSTNQRKAIKNPAPGLVVFDTTRQMFYGYVRGTGWRPFLMGLDSATVSQPVSPSVGESVEGDGFGYAVAIYDNIAIAGAPFDDINGNPNQGSIYVFRKTNNQWVKIQKLTVADGATNDQFGTGLAITKDFVFVAANQADVGENLDQGAAYVFKIQGDSLFYHQKLVGSTAGSNDQFSYYLAAQDKKLFVGTPYDDIGANTDQGSVYYFELVNNKWVEKQKIIQDSAAAAQDFFGFGISIDSNTIAIGGHIDVSWNYGYGQNAVFIYEKVGNLWQRRQKINQPNTAVKTEGFGYNTTLKDGILSVGAWLHDVPAGNKDRGAVYTFKKSGNVWNFTEEISPVDVNQGDTYGDYFGYSMRRDGKYMVVGSGYEDIAAGEIDRGAFYLYELAGDGWVLKKKIICPTPTYRDEFGRALAIQDGTILVGASRETIGGDGKIYFYTIED